MANVQIGSILRGLRIQSDLTQEQMAEGLDISQTYISQVERGERSPSWKLLVRYAAVAKVSIVSIFRQAGLLDEATQEIEDQIAELVAEEPEFRDLFDVVQEIKHESPARVEEIVRFARWVLEEERKRKEPGES